MDDAVDTYMSCRSIGRNTTKVFDYILPCASTKSAVDGSVPCSSACLNPPPPTFTPSVPPLAALPVITETEEEWEYDESVEIDVDFPDTATTAPTYPKPTSQETRISKDTILLFPTNPATPPTDVRPCDTPNGSHSLQDLTPNKIYHMFGNHHFRKYEHFGRIYKDPNFVQEGEPCPSTGEFSNLQKQACGKDLAPTDHYLDKVHLDIVFGDNIRKLGYR